MSEKLSQKEIEIPKWVEELTNTEFKNLLDAISETTDYEIDRRITAKTIMAEKNKEILAFILQEVENPAIKNKLKDTIEFSDTHSEKEEEEEEKVIIKQPRLKKPEKIIKTIPVKQRGESTEVDVSKLYDFLSLDEIRSTLPGIRTIQKQYEEGKFDESELLSELNQTLITARANNKGFDTNFRIAVEKSISNPSVVSGHGKLLLNESDEQEEEISEHSYQPIKFDKLARAINPNLERTYEDLKNMSLDKGLSNDVRSEISAITKRIDDRGSEFSLEERSAVDKFVENVQEIKEYESEPSKIVKQLKKEVKVVDRSVTSQVEKEEQQSLSKEIIDTEMHANRDDVTPDNEISPKASGLDQSKLKPGSSFSDVLENAIIQDAILTQKEKANLTHDQEALFDNIFADEQSIIDNAAELDQSILNQSSFDEMFGLFGKSFLEDVEEPNSERALLDITAVSTDGTILTAKEILNAIPTIIKKIGDIEGKIDLTERNLDYYKKETAIYKQQVQYKESNDFKIKSGTAFRTRVCC